LGKVYKSTSHVWTPIDSLSPSAAVLVQSLTVAGVRASTVGGYENFAYLAGYITGVNNTGGSAKTYGLTIEMARPVTSPTLIGDIDDAGLKIRMQNYATCFAGNTLRGFDVQVRNAADATITNIDGGAVSVVTRSGTGTTASARALQVESDLEGPVTDLHIPLDVRAFRQAATVPTLEAIARFRNGNLTGTGIASGILITSEGGAPSSIVNGIDMSGALITGSDIALSGTVNVYSGVAVTRAAVRAAVGDAAPQGSIFVGQASVATTKPNAYIKTANAGADSDWERIVTQASD
jgi:hypothetical protein